MKKIGITGGIGSGKTTICRIFELLGIPVFYADEAAKEVMSRDSILIDEIRTSFGKESYLSTGVLNRKHLAGIVFNDPDRLAQLNALVHPAVFRAFDLWADRQDAEYVIKEAALLIESRSYLDCDYTILVTAPTELRIERVVRRDKITAEEVMKRINRQLSDEEKEKICDFTVVNDEKKLLIPEVLRLHNIFLNKNKQ